MKSYTKYHFKGRWVYLVVLAMIVGLLSGMGLSAETPKEILIGGMAVEFTDIYLTETGGEEDVDVTQPIDNGETKEVVYKLKLTHCKTLSTAQAIEVVLPEELKLIHDEEIPLKVNIPGGDIKVVGKCSFTAEDGIGIMTFNEVLKDYESANLGFAIGVNINAKKIPGEEGTRSIKFKVGEIEKGLDVNFTGETKQEEEIETPPILTKTHNKVDEAQGKIEWCIHLKAGSKDLKDVVIKDTYSNMQLKFDTLKKDGASYEAFEIKTEDDKDVITIHIPELLAGEVCDFYVVTNIKKDVYKEDAKEVTIKNTASLQDQEGNRLITKDEIDAVKIKVGWITKSGKYREEQKNGMLIKKIDWKVIINRNKQDIRGYVLNDYLPKGVALEKDSIKINNKLLDEISDIGSIDYIEDAGSKAYVLQGEKKSFQYEGGIKYEFHKELTDEQAHKEYTLTYTTIITDSATESINKGEYYNLVGIGESEEVFHDYKDGKIFYDYKGVGIKISDVTKQVTNYNWRNHEITWAVVANRHNNEVKEIEMIDTLPEGLKINPNTIKINQKLITTQGEAISDDGDIIAEYGYSEEARELTCKIYSKTGKTFNEYYTLEFSTEVTEKEVYANNFSEGKDYINRVKSVYTDIKGEKNESPEVTAKQKVTGLIISKHAGNYNAQDGEMTWLIVVNQKAIAMKDVVIMDTLEKTQKYIEGSIKVVAGDYAAKDPKTIDEAQNIMPTLIPEVKEDGRVITCNLGDIDKTYTIILKTKINKDSIFIPNEKAVIHNTASISSPSIFEGIKSVTVEKEINNDFVLKAGKQLDRDEPLKWYLIVNPNQVSLHEIVVTDCLSEGLKLRMDSVEVFKVTELTKEINGLIISDAEGLNKNKVNLDEERINYDKKTNTIRFSLGDITDCYLIVFQTVVTDTKPAKQYTNKASIEGLKEEKWQTGSKEIEVKTQFSRSWGSVELPTGTIEIIKLDDENHTPLKGAEFKLSDGICSMVVETDDEGKAIFDGLTLGKNYKVYESKAPEGYKLDAKVETITLNSSQTIQREFINKKESPSPSPSPTNEKTIEIIEKEKVPDKPNTDEEEPNKSEDNDKKNASDVDKNDNRNTDTAAQAEQAANQAVESVADTKAVLDNREALPKTGGNVEFTMLLGGAVIMLASGIDYYRRNKKKK